MQASTSRLVPSLSAEHEAVGTRFDTLHLDALADRDHAVDVAAQPGRCARAQQTRVEARAQRVR